MKSFIITSLLGACIFSACQNEASNAKIMVEQPVQVDTFPGSCPYLTKDTKGNTVLSWARTINDSTFIFCYAVSKDGKSFSAPIVIPSSSNLKPHGENIPKLIFKPSGEVIAVWGAASADPRNRYAGRVFYAQSFDDGRTWSNARPLVNDTAGFDQRYYDVALLPDGEAAVSWLDNRKTTSLEGSGLYFAMTNGNNGFSGEKLISQPLCQCCRTDLLADSKGGIHVAFRGIINDSIRDMLHIVSTDGGKNFSAPQRINTDNWVLRGCPHTGPSMTENKTGLYFAWYTGAGSKGCLYTSSADNGNSFTQPDVISSKGAHPQISTLANGDLAIVWEEAVGTGNKLYKRIAMQKRAQNGVAEAKGFISPDTNSATYPVILALAQARSLVAYVAQKGERGYITYQVVD